MDKTVTSKYGLESVKIEKSLIYSDFILSSYSWLRLFPSHHLPMQNLEKMLERMLSGMMAPMPR